MAKVKVTVSVGGIQKMNNQKPKSFVFRRAINAVVISTMVFSLFGSVPVYAAAGSIDTVTGSCGSPVNENHYAVGDPIFISGSNFDEGSYDWDITGTPGSSDPSTAVASGNFAVDASGAFCFQA